MGQWRGTALTARIDAEMKLSAGPQRDRRTSASGPQLVLLHGRVGQPVHRCQQMLRDGISSIAPLSTALIPFGKTGRFGLVWRVVISLVDERKGLRRIRP